ncbi:prepilin-type N-terminal cleavage/methylation domain-containing protein [Nitratidesulfovibrio sp. SRB-5]|uniref:prepilin-type N-terminal cleavage/methylation domain-containing protein n=1 Tax=Nitratidesulfovibrio sp. SRB-5 TaxID=2872636 RepID=UPI001026367C|nr:prepilin-type N-terminal cleavage/methylation domain-containing protein [Nitratidesulfovibrio sp. SRB-5]MBZ2173511.1 prepilin-type N-terminal cleavage/methylation domain-containing protein [Nitratidesulfovibrio sp. SRB-5]RXF76651.1 prepilin-type N-terminal cleavage/methylation domain-containing protein [Desulfovibrio sp. DS-1]
MNPHTHRTDARHPARADLRAGFTLIEIIITVVLAALMGLMMLSVSGTALRGSTESYGLAVTQAQLTDIIESMTADYRALYSTESDPIATITGRIGTAGSTQTNNRYTTGSYTVVVNRRIRFAGSAPNFTEQSDSNGDMLRVTIAVGDSTATTLFSR